jgi:hypothetical protein
VVPCPRDSDLPLLSFDFRVSLNLLDLHVSSDVLIVVNLLFQRLARPGFVLAPASLPSLRFAFRFSLFISLLSYRRHSFSFRFPARVVFMHFPDPPSSFRKVLFCLSLFVPCSFLSLLLLPFSYFVVSYILACRSNFKCFVFLLVSFQFLPSLPSFSKLCGFPFFVLLRSSLSFFIFVSSLILFLPSSLTCIRWPLIPESFGIQVFHILVLGLCV